MCDLKYVEIRGECGEKYPAELQEICDDFVRVKYQELNDFIHDVPIQFAFYAPNRYENCLSINLPELMAGTLVDVYCISNNLPFVETDKDDFQIKAWWPGIVRKRQGDLVVVDLLDLSSIECIDLSSNNLKILRKEIVDIDSVRIRSEGVNLCQKPLKSVKIEIPQSIRKCFRDSNCEEDLKKWLGDAVSFTKTNDLSYIVIFSTDNNVIHKVNLIGKKWVQQFASRYNLTQQVKDTKNKKQVIFQEEFNVIPQLLGFALGEDFSNLNRVSQIPDVVLAELVDPRGKFNLMAKTETALKLAREQLEVVEQFVRVDKSILGILVSGDKKLLEGIVKESGIFRLMIIGNDVRERLYEENEDRSSVYNATCENDDSVDESGLKKPNVTISLTGTLKCVDLASRLIRFSVDNLKNQINLKQSALLELDSEIMNDIRAHSHKVSENMSVKKENIQENRKPDGALSSR